MQTGPQIVFGIVGGLSAIVGATVFGWFGVLMWKLATQKADRSALLLALGSWSSAGLIGLGVPAILLDDFHGLSHTQERLLHQIVGGSMALSGALLTVGFLMSSPPSKKP